MAGNGESPAATPVSDHRRPPRGVLPKNAQTWLILAISLVVILVIAFSGNPPRKPASTVTSQVVPSADPTPPPSTAEEEIQKRLAELQRLQEEGMKARAPSGLPRSPSFPEVEALGPLPASGQGPSQDDFEEEMRRREYTSLFASNVALTYREDGRGTRRAATPDAPQSPDAPALPSLPQFLQGFPAGTASPGAAPAAAEPAPPTRAPNPATPPAMAEAAQRYVLFEGTVLETALINRLAGEYAGPVLTMVTTPVYSHDRQEVLIPAGTKCIGEAKRVESLGQTRLAVVFHRLIMPDGYSVDLDQFQGLNQIGDTGLKDKVNHHYLQIFGASMAIGALGAVSNRVLSFPYGASAGSTFAESAARVLDKFLNILPTITIREGHRVKIFLAQDLDLPAYKHHAMRKDI